MSPPVPVPCFLHSNPVFERGEEKEGNEKEKAPFCSVPGGLEHLAEEFKSLLTRHAPAAGIMERKTFKGPKGLGGRGQGRRKMRSCHPGRALAALPTPPAPGCARGGRTERQPRSKNIGLTLF